MDWEKAPEWANYAILLEGGRFVWSPDSSPNFSFEFVDHNFMLDNDDEMMSLKVESVIPRPVYVTKVYLKEGHKLAEYKADGMLSHEEVKRYLKKEGWDVKSLRFMLEYREK